MTAPTIVNDGLLEWSVAERLAACGLEMGATRTWVVPPGQKIQREDMPCAYTLIGPTYQPVTVAQGILTVARTYIQRVLIMPWEGKPTDVNEGHEAVVKAIAWAGRLHAYYHDRPQLNTQELPALRYCKSIFSTSDSGLVQRTAPGGTLCAAVDFSLNIIMTAKANKIYRPYTA